MNSTITVKFQTTIPKAVRERLGIRVNDAIEWRVLKGKAEVVPVRTSFLRHRNAVRVGAGDLRSDLDAGRVARAERQR
jgi:AbrB family looped-hinge helix DNA binding protein